MHNAAYGFLLLAMGALGVGFGGTLTMINTYAAGFFPEKTATALTVLHAILGTGTALAPILLAGFVRAGGWWGQPVRIGPPLPAIRHKYRCAALPYRRLLFAFF